MSKQIISTPHAPGRIGVYSQAVRVGNTIWVSGQIPLDPKTKELVSAENWSRRCARFSRTSRPSSPPPAPASTTWSKRRFFLVDLSHFALVNKVMAEYFREPYPARAPWAWPHCRAARRSKWSALSPSSASVTAPNPVTVLRGVGDAWRRGCARWEWRPPRICCSCCRRATRIRTQVVLGRGCGRTAGRSGRRVPASPKSCFAAGGKCCAEIGDGSGFLTLRFFYFTAQQRGGQNGLARGRAHSRFGEARRGPQGLEIVHPEITGASIRRSRAVFEDQSSRHLPLSPRHNPGTAAHGRPAWPSINGARHIDRLAAGRRCWRIRACLRCATAFAYVHRPPADAPVDLLLSGPASGTAALGVRERSPTICRSSLCAGAFQSVRAGRLECNGDLKASLLPRCRFGWPRASSARSWKSNATSL